MKNKHIGSNFDGFLEEEGILAETEAIAVKKSNYIPNKANDEKKTFNKNSDG